MRLRYVMLAAAFGAALVLAGGTGLAMEVKLQLTETEKAARSPGAVTSGVPFAKGAVKDVSKLAVSCGGKALPAQFKTTVKWDDGSVRWALLDTLVEVPAGGKAELVLTDGGRNPAPPAPVKVEDGPDAVKLSTGPLVASISKKKFNLFESVKVDGKELVTGAGKGLVILKEGGGEVLAGPPAEVKIEHAGPVRATVCLRGKFPGVHNDLLAYTARVTALAGQKRLKVQVWLENQGAMGYRGGNEGGQSTNVEWFAFDGMAVDLGLGLGENVTARCEGVEAQGKLRVFQFCRQTTGQEKVRYKKGPFYTWTDFGYTVAGGDGKELKKGDRTDGVVALKGDAGTLTAAVRDFWQNYEKAVELDGKALRLWLWPTEGQWPRPRPNLNSRELYDKNLMSITKPGLYLLSGSVHKGHELVLDFSGRPAAESAAELNTPLFALATAEHHASTGALPGLFAPPGVKTGDRECDSKLASWDRMLRSAVDPASPSGLVRARQVSSESNIWYFQDSTYWYGWMDFGDISLAGRGPISLHCDWTWIMLLGAVRTGDPAFLRIGAEMARHRIDIDQRWSDRDPPHCSRLQSGGGFPSFHTSRFTSHPNVRSNWLAGVVLYYMLTGEEKALECATRNAEGLKAGWEHIAKTNPWGGPQGDMSALGWSMISWCAMYDLTSDKQWLDEATKLFRGNVTALWKSRGPFLHDPRNQIRSQDYAKEDIKYCHAIEALCELHHRTGDENVLKLLAEGCEKEFPPSYFDAPVFLSGLYAYVGHRTGKPELLAKGTEAFIQGFPDSKCPPVFLPENSTWSWQSAMMLRAGHLLQYAHWKKSAGK